MVFPNQTGSPEQPFSNTPDPKFFFPTKTHQDALSQLRTGIVEKKGFLVLTGDVGTGKTTLCRTLLGRLGDGEVETALVLNPDLSETEILAAIARDFGLEGAGASKSQLMELLYQHLVRRARAGCNSLIVIDDAQNLPLRSLEQVRMISNFETAKEKLVQILLVGQPELTARLPTQEFRQVRQRIAVHAQLTPLSAKETRAYILHRLATADVSATTVSFTEASFARIHKETRGFPRSINTLCDRTLAEARKRHLHAIGPKDVHDVARTLRIRVPLRTRLAARGRFIGSGAAAACVAAVTVAALYASLRVPPAPPPTVATAAIAPTASADPALQAKLAAVESTVASLERRLGQLGEPPDVTGPLLQQSEALEKSLALARGESHRLNTLLRQKEEELRALTAPRADAPPAAEPVPAIEQREADLQAALASFQEESRSRSEQVRHLEKALQTLKARLAEAERQREELNRSLREKEQQAAAPVGAGESAADLGRLEVENAQLRRNTKLLQGIAEKTIRAQSQEIEELRRERDQLLHGVGETGADSSARGETLAVAR